MKKLSFALCTTALIGALTMPQPLEACGPFFQPSYLEDINCYKLHYSRSEALARLIKLCDDLIPTESKLPKGTTTKKAELLDFASAVKEYLADMPQAEQQKLIDAYTNYMNRYWRRECNIEAFPELPDELLEFKLYRFGVDEMHKIENVEKGVFPSWEKLLQLPPEKRRYRTTWVHYMKGNIFKEAKHYQECRKAARAGFVDTPGLGRASYSKEYSLPQSTVVQSLYVWAEACKSDPELNFLTSKEFNTRFITSCSDEDYAAMLLDPLGREIIAVFGDYKRKAFIIAAHNYKFRNADVIAFHYYRSGNTEAASQWLKRIEKPTLLSVYLEARIARINGNITLAVAKLHTWLEMVKKADPADNRNIISRYYPNLGERSPLELDVYGILGNSMVMRRDFVEAAEFFYRAEQMESDIATIAECYLNMDELVKFTEYVSKDAPYNGCGDINPKVNIAKTIRHLTARRAFREGRMDIAKKYMPEWCSKDMENYLQYLAKSKDKKYSADERALALYNAAKIMRFKGMELCGTEIDPDNHRYDGNHYAYHWATRCPQCKFDPIMGTWSFCKKANAGGYYKGYPGFNAVKNYLDVPWYQRWHYRYKACAMALEAAEMAEDVELKALIYYFGGEILRRQSPHEADVFYKRLVRNCHATELGKLADVTRWFPVENIILRKEVRSIKPCPTVAEAKKIMQKAFPAKPQPQSK